MKNLVKPTVKLANAQFGLAQGPFLATLFGVGCLALMDALMKDAALAAGAYSAALLRAGIAAAIITPVWVLREGRIPPKKVTRLHLLRGTISAFMALSFFYALTKLPIAEAIAISFIAPIIALYLAAIVLGEQVSRRSVLVSTLGFGGALVIIGGRLGQANADIETLKGVGAILFSASLYAWYLIVIRQQAQVASPIEATTFHTLVSFVVLGLAAPWLLVLPDMAILATISQASVLTVIGALAISWAYARAEAQVLIPLEYSGFVWASLFGWLFFAERVSLTTIIGAGLIIWGCWLMTRDPARRQTQ